MKVTPIQNRPFCFFVESRSGGEDRFVDWLNHSCTCEDFTMRRAKFKAATGEDYVCDHLEAARNQSWREMLEDVRTILH